MARGGEDSNPVAFWHLTKNPIFQRYLRSRLRPKSLIPWLLVVGILAVFVFLAIWVGVTQSADGDAMMAGRIILIVMIPIQGFILMIMGTGAVASGMMLEGEDGGIEYQRLTPLSPLAKIAGYLFGLPIRDRLFLVTLPITILAVIVGQVPVASVLSLYVAFFAAVILYHLSGCVAGTVVNRRFAGRIAQMIVIILYLVLPQIAKLGFEFFSYLTILPVLKGLIADISLPYARDGFGILFGDGVRSVSLYGIELDALPFSLLMQGTLIVTFVVVLYRKWRQPTHHMLGKNFAVFLCLWIHALLLGSTIPLIDTGEIFPDRGARTARIAEEISRQNPGAGIRPGRPWVNRKDPGHAYWLSSLYGLGSLIFSCVLVMAITPDRDKFTKGLRRARKLGRRRVPLNSDGASAMLHVLVIGLAGAAAFAIFAAEMYGSRWFSKEMMGGMAPEFSMATLQAVPFSQLLFVLAFWAVLEWGGKRSLLIFCLFGWVVPVLAALVFLLAGEQFHRVAITLGGLSALPSPFYAVSYPIEGTRWTITSVARTFIMTLAVYLPTVIYLIARVKGHHRRIIRRVEGGDAPPPASREVG